MNALPASSPFAHAGASVSNVMLQVCVALIPCTLFGIYIFGLPAAFLFLVTCASALATELLCLIWLKQPWYRVLDGSALLTGWLLALCLPPWAPWWIGALGGFFAIAVGKQLYGGIGQNIFNPAMLARTALLITFPVQMTLWTLPEGASAISVKESIDYLFLGASIPDAHTGATYLGEFKTSLSLDSAVESKPSLWLAFSGQQAGSMGETSELLILLGAAFLFLRRIISWEIPLAMLSSLFLLTAIAYYANSAQFADPIFHLTSGGVFFAAFFIATDPVTSPISRSGKLIFGIGCASVIFIIRQWGSFPEAVAFAVLFMNALTPLIDRYFRPRIYGRDNSGKPLPELSGIELARESQKTL